MRGRGERLARLTAEAGLDRMLVTNLVNVRYLTGFGGTNGACVCGDGVRTFLTDFRYTERAEAEVEGWDVVTVTDDWVAGIAARLAGRTGFEDDQMSVRLLGRLREKLPDGAELEAAGGTVEKLRRVKDEREQAAIAAAAELADDVWRWSLERGLAGPQRARRRRRRGSADARARRRALLSGDRRGGPERRPAARRAGRADDRRRGAGRLRHGGQARRLLLRRHQDVRHRRAGRGGAPGL